MATDIRRRFRRPEDRLTRVGLGGPGILGVLFLVAAA